MLTINHLTKHYPGSQKGITDLTLHIEKGDLISTYSHGMKQKLAIIAALIHDPKAAVFTAVLYRKNNRVDLSAL